MAWWPNNSFNPTAGVGSLHFQAFAAGGELTQVVEDTTNVIRSADEFAQLRTSEVPDEQHRATHDQASEQVWLDVIERFPDLRDWVALNKTVPLSILELLSNDKDARVRSVVADKRKLSPALRQKLSQDRDASVRERIACNPKCELEILRALANDEEAFVREAAIDKLHSRASVL